MGLALCTLAVLLTWYGDLEGPPRARSCRAIHQLFRDGRYRPDEVSHPYRGVLTARTDQDDISTATASLPSPSQTDAEPPALRQYEVRHLLSEDRTIEKLASSIEARCKGVTVQPRVNVLELLAPMETHLRVERALEELRQEVQDSVLEIHPIADLASALDTSSVDATSFAGLNLPADDDQVEPCALFEADQLREVIRLTIPGTFTIRVQGLNLVVFGDPSVQRRVAEFLHDLRKNVNDAPREPAAPPPSVD